MQLNVCCLNQILILSRTLLNRESNCMLTHELLINNQILKLAAASIGTKFTIPCHLMMMREQQWDRSNCRHFRIDVCLHQRIYMRAFVNAMSRPMGKPTICTGENIGVDQLCSSAFVFATRIVQSLNTKLHASSCLLLLCSPICVGPVRKPHCWFSHEAAQMYENKTINKIMRRFSREITHLTPETSSLQF